MNSSPPPMDLPPFPSEWSDFLDLTFDDHLFLPLDAPPPEPDTATETDPRLECSNFLAGRVPCACPEMDALMEEKAREEGEPWKKRVRVARGGKAICQVPDCDADITLLKGYHRRHRVCLACANASSVVVDGDAKRYCQQCGKFHILSDFDEGRRSCRRKLERHNNRRRRKPVDSRGAFNKEPQLDPLGENLSSDEEVGKGYLCSTSQNTEVHALQGPKDGNMLNNFSGSDSKVVPSDSAATFTASGETLVDGGQEDSKFALSPSYFDSKSTYSSACPTGRISFKLYDWNPAEFPGRLRLQIFQWLASMPVELEGYIRPGCTILTAFISMPQSMWVKLFEDPASYLHDILNPGRALSGKGTALIYVNDMVFRVLRDGISVVEANVAKQAPKVHYVHPSCFEAGKPMEFIVCGSNLFQPNFRSLVSFGGKYLDHEYNVAFHSGKIDAEASSFHYQFCRIHVPCTEPKFCGPAFIEIENESGLSNFIPIIICDKQVCSELRMIQGKYKTYSGVSAGIESVEPSHYTRPADCSGQPFFSNFMLDVAWLLKQPAAEKMQHDLISSEMRRFGHLLSFLVRQESVYILIRILMCVEAVLQKEEYITNGVYDTDRRFLLEHVDHARNFLFQNLQKECQSSTSVQTNNKFFHKFLQDDAVNTIPADQKMGANFRSEVILIASDSSASSLEEQTAPLLNKDVAVDMVDVKLHLKESYSLVRSRPSIVMLAAFAVCFGVCTVVFHPSHVSRIVVSIKRCLYEYTL